MGAALTYARRYALFTLVGIAGEDDLDAPDLDRFGDSPARFAETGRPTLASGAGASADPDLEGPIGSLSGNSPRKPQRSIRQLPTAEASIAVRDQLIGELNSLNSADALTGWAQRTLPIKNNLTAADAEKLENAFADKVASLAATLPSARRPPAQRPNDPRIPTEIDIPEVVRANGASSEPNENPSPDRKTASEAPTAAYLPKQSGRAEARLASPRLRDKEHLKYVRSQACLICGRSPSESHHLRFAQKPALGRKVSDEFTVPVCRLHHRELHRHGNEAQWWETVGVDAIGAARKLWIDTHPPLRTDGDAVPTGVPHSDVQPANCPEHSSTKRTQSGTRHGVHPAD